MFPVTQIPQGAADLFEQLGTKRKFWYEENRHLFKIGREGTGENWAEVVCAYVANTLGLPHATYALAVYEGIQGVTTPNFVPEGGRLVHGNELIGISPGATAAVQNRRVAHTVGRISALMRQQVIFLPLDWAHPAAVEGAAGVMAGYLMLDALVANQDRHEQNWGLVEINAGITLAPTFDHASSLGRNESDERRLGKLRASNANHSIEGYANRALTPIYAADGRRLSTLQAFAEFAANFKDSANYWLSRLRQVDETYFDEVLSRVPAEWISDPAREFASRLMVVNRRRLLGLNL